LTEVKILLLTRPIAQSRAFAHELESRFDNLKCLISPLLEIQQTGVLPTLSPFQALIFTSVNGVQAFAARTDDRRWPCFCVGDRTTAAAKSHGFSAISANGGAPELIELVASTLSPTDGELLHVRGANAAGDIVTGLAAHGFKVRKSVLYRQLSLPLSMQATKALAAGEIDGIPLFSPRTAQLLEAKLITNPAWPLDHITAFCISPNVTSVIKSLKLRHIETAPTPTRSGMLAIIEAILGQNPPS